MSSGLLHLRTSRTLSQGLVWAGCLGFCVGLSAQQTDALTDSAAPQNIMIVLDSSRSMWGQIDGVAKREIAQQTLRSMLPTLPESAKLGLVAYGHRKESDCDDIEVLHSVGSVAASELSDTAAGLNAKGKTPLTAAVQSAAATMAIESEKATVILITDGLETCNADPCALGKQLESEGVDFTAHVIGFGLSQQEGLQVSCLAEETGGLYIQAEDSADLRDALETVALDVSAEETAEIAGSATVEVPSPTVVAGSKFDVNWTGPKNSLDSLTVRSIDAETSYDREYIYRDEDVSPSAATAPEAPGEYDVHYETRKGASLAKARFTVVAAQATVSAPKQEVRADTRFEAEFTGPANQFDQVVIADPEKPGEHLSRMYVRHAKEGRARLRAPAVPGNYSIEYQTRAGKVLASATLVVAPAKAWIKPPETPVVAGAYFESQVSGDPGDADVLIIVDPENDRKPIDSGYIQHAKEGKVKLLAPLAVGEYEMQYRDRAKEIQATGTLKVVAPDTALVLPALPLTAGERFKIGVGTKRGEFDKLAIVAAGAPDTEIDSNYLSGAREGALTFTAPLEPGKYLLHYQDRKGRVLSTVELPVAVRR